MNGLKTGFARMNIAPALGIGISGYYVERNATGILDDLEVNALAVECGCGKAVLISVDNCGVAPTAIYSACRARVSKETGVPEDCVFISSTHTHTSPFWGEGNDPEVLEYTHFLESRIADAAKLSIEDLLPAKMGWGVSEAKNVAFVRRFRMKDGSIRTNPGVDNPDILAPIGDVDERVNVLRFQREGGQDIVLVNFGNHPDVVGGTKLSADWPGFLRRRVEKALDGVQCIFFNGAQGDVNHVNVHPRGGDLNDMFMDFDDVSRGYGHARHIGNVLAGAVLQVYDKVCWQDVQSVSAAIRTIEVSSNMPPAEAIPKAKEYVELHRSGHDDRIPFEGMQLTTVVAEAERMCRLENGPASFKMPLSCVAIGNIALIGLPGEPFTGIGRALKEAPGWELVLPCCITNGYEGYFPMKEAYDEGGYEARSSIYAAGVAERIVEEGLTLLDQMRAGR